MISEIVLNCVYNISNFYRYKLFEKAFRLAIDLNDHDLFMDIHFYAVALNDTEMATAAKEKAELSLSRSSSCSSSRECAANQFNFNTIHFQFLN